MKLNIVTAFNGVGLERDYEILREELVLRGHEVTGVDHTHPQGVQFADVNLHLEIITTDVFPYAKEQWLMPNPEWWGGDGWTDLLGRFSKVLCKTKHAEEIFSRIKCQRGFSYDLVRTGFRSRDLFNSGVTRERKFLHVAGKGSTRGTEAVYTAWTHFGITVPLTILSANPLPKAANVTQLTRVSDEELAELMNNHLFHLCPSETEGWGHAIHEAMSVGSVIISTNAPPMNEWPLGFFVSPGSSFEHGLTRAWKVDGSGVWNAVQQVSAWHEDVLKVAKLEAYCAFHKEKRCFDAAMNALFGEKK